MRSLWTRINPRLPQPPRLTQAPTPPQPNMGQVAAEFFEQLELYREGLDAEGRDLSEDEVKSVKEHWGDIVKRAEGLQSRRRRPDHAYRP